MLQEKIMVYISQNQSFLKNEERKRKKKKKTKPNKTKIKKEKKFITLNKHEFYDET